MRKITLFLSVLFKAQTETEAVVKMTWVDYNNPTTAMGEIPAGETARAGYNKISGGSVAFANTGWGENKITYIQVDASSCTDDIVGATLTIEVSGSSDGKRTTGWGVGYNSSVWSADMTYDSADKTITTLGGQLWTSTKSASTFEAKEFDILDAFKNDADADKIVTILVYETAAAGGYIKNPKVTILAADASAMTTYTVKYVDEAGNEIADASVYDILTGEVASIADENKVAIWNADNTVKYIYASCDNESITTVADGASNVITATFREAATYSYTVNAVDGEGNVLKEIAASVNLEGESVTIPYNQHILVDDVLYSASANNKEYNTKITLSSDEQVSAITYSASSISDVVYFSEAEEIEGMTITTGGNANVRCSNAAGGYNASAEPIVVTTLTPGVYNIVAQVWGNAGVDFNIICGSNTLTVSTKGYILSGNAEFVITEDTEVTVLQAGANGKCIDWIYIQSVEKPLVVTDGEDLTATGSYSSASYVRQFNTAYTYGTICLPFAPDAATCANYTFYKLAEVNSEALIFEEEVAPKANTAYLYKLNDGVDAETAKTFTGGVTTISDIVTEPVGGWQFIGSFAKTEITDLTGGDYWAYQAEYNSKKDVLVKAGTKLVAHPYRAYFKFVPTEELNFTPATSTMRMIIGGKEGGAMEIQEVIAPEQVEGAAFDLEGRPVENMQKGQIYIIGGKKVKK